MELDALELTLPAVDLGCDDLTGFAILKPVGSKYSSALLRDSERRDWSYPPFVEVEGMFAI